MGSSSPDPPVNTFVVRFWREWSVAGPRWRGQIDHVQSGENARFLDLEGMLDIIRCFGVMRQCESINTYEEPVQRVGCPSDVGAGVVIDKDRDQHDEDAVE